MKRCVTNFNNTYICHASRSVDLQRETDEERDRRGCGLRRSSIISSQGYAFVNGCSGGASPVGRSEEGGRSVTSSLVRVFCCGSNTLIQWFSLPLLDIPLLASILVAMNEILPPS